MIGVFDSGVGGLGVFGEVRRLLPEADLLYLADHEFAPYGTRRLDELAERCETVATWLIDSGCSVVTLACNTASAAALHPLRRAHPSTAFVGMEPALKPAASTTGTGRVGVVATAATFQGELFESAVARFGTGVEVVTAACPRWVELVEAGSVSGPETRSAIETCLAPMVASAVDVLVLACTHYPALTPVIAEVLGPKVKIIDPAPAVARQTTRLAVDRDAARGGGTTHLFTTGDTGRLEAAASRSGIRGPVSLLRLS